MRILVTGAGIVLLAGALLACASVLLRSARRSGILRPVAVGLGLRLTLMLAVHAASVLDGQGGLMFVDDRTYYGEGMVLAEAWRAGRVVDPSSFEYSGTPIFGFQALLATSFVPAPGIVAGKLLNVLAGAAVIVVVARLAERVLGERALRPAAWMAALLPGLVWWSAPLMKEAVATLLLCSALLAALHLPSPRAVAALAALLAALAVTRPVGALAVVAALVCVLGTLAARHRRRVPWRAVAAYASAAVALALTFLLVVSRGDLAGYVESYRTTVANMIALYRGPSLSDVPLDVVRALISPYPWAFDPAARNWDMGLYPGMWTWYALYPAAAVGVWRLRRRPEAMLLVLTALVYLVLNGITSGFVFRQRSALEPLVILLVLGSGLGARDVARLGSAALVAIAAAAGLHLRDPIAPAAILAGAGALLLLSSRLPVAGLPLTAPAVLAPALQRLALPGKGEMAAFLGRFEPGRHAPPPFAPPPRRLLPRDRLIGPLVRHAPRRRP